MDWEQMRHIYFEIVVRRLNKCIFIHLSLPIWLKPVYDLKCWIRTYTCRIEIWVNLMSNEWVQVSFSEKEHCRCKFITGEFALCCSPSSFWKKWKREKNPVIPLVKPCHVLTHQSVSPVQAPQSVTLLQQLPSVTSPPAPALRPGHIREGTAPNTPTHTHPDVRLSVQNHRHRL